MAVIGIQPHIPTEVYFDFLGMTIPIHWDYHAILMVAVWFVLVPICIITIRFGKPKPTLTGLHRESQHQKYRVVVVQRSQIRADIFDQSGARGRDCRGDGQRRL